MTTFILVFFLLKFVELLTFSINLAKFLNIVCRWWTPFSRRSGEASEIDDSCHSACSSCWFCVFQLSIFFLLLRCTISFYVFLCIYRCSLFECLSSVYCVRHVFGSVWLSSTYTACFFLWVYPCLRAVCSKILHFIWYSPLLLLISPQLFRFDEWLWV